MSAILTLPPGTGSRLPGPACLGHSWGKSPGTCPLTAGAGVPPTSVPGARWRLPWMELGEIADRGETPEDTVGRKELVAAVNRFLQALPQRERSVFLCRYWYLDSLEDIAAKTGLTKGHISTMLHRTRKRLCICLQKEGLL